MARVPQSQSSQIMVEPEFYDHNEELSKVASRLSGDKYHERTKNSQMHGYGPEQYILLWEERFKRHEQQMQKLWEMYTTMHRRFRGVTISDQFGYFGTQPETQGRWIEYNPDTDGEVHPINIVRPDIRANVSALLQIDEGIDVDSPNQDARYVENARRLQYLVDFFQRDTWTDADRALLFDGIQKEGTILIENFLDRDKTRLSTVTLPTKIEQHYAAVECQNCGVAGVKEITEQELESHDGRMVDCPECDLPVRMVAKTRKNYDVEDAQVRTSDINHRFWSGFNFIIDRIGARNKGIQGARFLRTMDLVERAELEDEYPQFHFSSPYEWCYGLKCQHALANSDWSMLYSSWAPTTSAPEWDLFQKNTNFLHESSYRNYISPSDWEFRGRDGKRKFKIERGQSWKEAVENCFGKGVHGFRYVTVNEQLIDIQTPPDFEPDFRKAFSECHFQRDSGSYLSVPHWDSVQMQDDITLFNTLKVETAARNSVEPVWFNSEIFSVDDFGRDYIPSIPGTVDADTGDISRQVFKPAIARSADGIAEHLGFLMDIRREVSGVQPALLGQAQPNQPYAAQRQQLDQAFGLLTSAGKSYAEMKVTSTKQKIVFAFNNWSLEQFQEVASSFGESWDEDDVESLVRTDLTRDVSIGYIPGSETPQGNLTKELKFFNGLREVMPWLQMPGAVDPAVQQQILKRVGEFSEFDLDLSGAETTDALAQKRFRSLSNACAEYRFLKADDIVEYKQQIVSYEPVQGSQEEAGDTAAMPSSPPADASEIPPQQAQLPAAPDAEVMGASADAIAPDASGTGAVAGGAPESGAAPIAMSTTGSPAASQENPAAGQQDPMANMQPIYAWDLLQEEIVQQAQLSISPYENFQAQIDFFLPQITIELSRPKPNHVLVDMMQWFVGQLQGQMPPAGDAPEIIQKLIAGMPYKGLPGDIKRQYEQRVGFTPSQDGTTIEDTALVHKATVEAKKVSVTEELGKEKLDIEREKLGLEKDKIVLGEASKENDRDFQREQAANNEADGEVSHKRTLELEEVRNQGKAEIAKAKPTPKKK